MDEDLFDLLEVLYTGVSVVLLILRLKILPELFTSFILEPRVEQDTSG